MTPDYDYKVPDTADDLTDPDREDPPFTETPTKLSDPRAVRLRAVDRTAAELTDEAAMIWVASTPEGRKFLVRLFAACGLEQKEFNPDDRVMCEIAGRRSIGRQVDEWLQDASFELWGQVRQALAELRRNAQKAPVSKRGRRA